MRLPFINELTISKQQRRQGSTINTAPTRSPLHIPEILEAIFSFVGNLTLRQTVVLVCRQWLLMNRHRVVREIVRDGSGRKKELIRTLSAAGCWSTAVVLETVPGRREGLLGTPDGGLEGVSKARAEGDNTGESEAELDL
ncbi:hypothetical protein BGX29_008825 [Mortierella sp. GBA35]|nr:hypothetical protein BGX29_008825 [Mortierella sp. GBA35]